MKFNNRKSFLTQLLIVVALIGLFAALALPRAQAQVTPGTIFAATNLPAVVATTVTTNCVSYLSVYNNSGLAGAWTFTAASSGSSNAVLFLYPTVDGTNYATVAPARFALTNNANGATAQRIAFNYSANDLRGIRGFQIGFYNQNAGNLTNSGIIFNRPNP